MKATLGYRTLAVLTLAAVPALALAHPLKVRPAAGESQTVIMCPDCSQPIACARVGDYTVSFAAAVDHPKTGSSAQFNVRLADRDANPVSNLKVAVVLSMPGHEHQPTTVPMKAEKDGRYTATTSFKAVGMEGPWRAEVKITTAKGDVVTQPFTFNR
jgi:hypothetical protein